MDDLKAHPEEVNTTKALVRGVAATFAQRGAELNGFLVKVKSTVLPGSGLSSSAALWTKQLLLQAAFEKLLDVATVLRVCIYARVSTEHQGLIANPIMNPCRVIGRDFSCNLPTKMV